jgi:SAM-dependent methyltransferase
VHDTAHEHGRLFFELYGSDALRTVVELGSQDVNGSLRDQCPPGVHYIGLDMIAAKGVDLVVDPGAPLPLASGTADAVVTSSAFEHDICFWETFLELTRILRPGGLLYVNAPSNGDFHRYPLDCWRFYPDAGVALIRWAARRGTRLELVESFIGLPKAERWADFVAVFRKSGGTPLTRKGRIADHAAGINVHDRDRPTADPLGAQSGSMPDTMIANTLRADVAAATAANETLTAALASANQTAEALSADLTAARQSNDALTTDLAAARTEAALLQQTRGALEHSLAAVQQDLLAMRNSTSWRLTAGPRRLASLLRGR